MKTHLGSLGMPLRAVLLIDNCPAHPPDLTVDTADGAIECRVLPANTTSHFQPLDQGPLEVMKRHYRRHLIQNLVSDPAVLVNDAIKAGTLKDAIFDSHDTQMMTDYYYYYVFILSAISPYTTGLKALFNQSDCTGTAPTHK